VNTELIVGENRELVIDICDAEGIPLAINGWTLELRLGGASIKLTKGLTISGSVTGRASCTFIPNELSVVGVGGINYSIWRTNVGAVWLVSEGTVIVRRVL
jgi:hypothetical protein